MRGADGEGFEPRRGGEGRGLAGLGLRGASPFEGRSLAPLSLDASHLERGAFRSLARSPSPPHLRVYKGGNLATSPHMQPEQPEARPSPARQPASRAPSRAEWI